MILDYTIALTKLMAIYSLSLPLVLDPGHLATYPRTCSEGPEWGVSEETQQWEGINIEENIGFGPGSVARAEAHEGWQFVGKQIPATCNLEAAGSAVLLCSGSS